MVLPENFKVSKSVLGQWLIEPKLVLKISNGVISAS
jgi:hypothetical protein